MYRTSYTTGKDEARELLKPRRKDVHKGDMGHAAILAGSVGMMGASILAGRGCLRSGCGKLTLFCTPSLYPILQVSVPEAIFRLCPFDEWPLHLSDAPFQSIGYGPGLSFPSGFETILAGMFSSGIPLVIDADGINQISRSGVSMMDRIPKGTILTPHQAEYERLFGRNSDPFVVSRKYQVVLVMKGPNTRVFDIEGNCFENQSGNAGLATAGSGDVLTGMITGLLARGYTPIDAARLGVFLHGLAGDLAADRIGQESILAGDLPDFIGPAYKELMHIGK
jgi:ADP-dependent NAD(P)H-hydrate dehydratase / NAD(P)H-hydrate epimerase